MKNRFLNMTWNHTTDAALLLSRDGLVLNANSFCASTLAMSADVLQGQSYSWSFFHETENHELSRLINDGLKKEIEYDLKEIDFKNPQGAVIKVLVSTLMLTDWVEEPDGVDKPILLVLIKSANSTDAGGAGATALSESSLETVVVTEQNRLFLQNRRRLDLFYASLAGLVLLIMLLIIFSSQRSIRIFSKTIETNPAAMERRFVAARLDTLARLVQVAGTLEPHYKVTLTAQTSGPIIKMNFQPGDFVEKGRILYQLDTKEMAKNVRTARVTYIELLEQYNQLQDWPASLEVMQAKRSMELAKIAESNEKKKLDETKKLYEKGIIPRVEFDQANTTYKKTGYDYENAKQQLETILDKGSAEKIEVLKLRLSNAKEELDEIEARYEASVVRAPVAGMVMAPETGDGRRGTIKKEGEMFKEGDLIATIGATESYIINTQVGELNVQDLEIGQTVEVTGLAFPHIMLKGKIDWIAAAATIAEDGRYFPMRISIPETPPDARKQVRFGMLADAIIRLPSLEKVVTVPLAALGRKDGHHALWIKGDKDEAVLRTVQPGYSDGNKIVIETGLQPGEQVSVPGI